MLNVFFNALPCQLLKCHHYKAKHIAIKKKVQVKIQSNHMSECQLIQMHTPAHTPVLNTVQRDLSVSAYFNSVNLILEEPCGGDNCHGYKLNSYINC